ncbi:MAG: 30S ribosomal protein S17 [Chloroflexi bacterium]|nr:30S ribosomal protein S17 [Chloroflexota bacterium]|tara:strand:+ start:4926 stop:5429 length:504 start_codon:yes stop_codon:yes gene_type:complete
MAKQGRVFTGRVVSSAMSKTVVISVDRIRKHPVYGKRIRRKVQLYAHDPENLCNNGDLIRIIESRPYSKLKKFRFLDFVERKSDGQVVDEISTPAIPNSNSFKEEDQSEIEKEVVAEVVSPQNEEEQIVEEEQENVDSVSEESPEDTEDVSPQNEEDSEEQIGRSDQ